MCLLETSLYVFFNQQLFPVVTVNHSCALNLIQFFSLRTSESIFFVRISFFHSTDSLPGNATFGLDFLPEHVCESDRGACVCTQLFSPACHLVEIDGEKCPIKRKPV